MPLQGEAKYQKDKTAKERMRRYRNKKRNEIPESVTVSVIKKAQSVTPSVTAYHPVLKWLVAGEKREVISAMESSYTYAVNNNYINTMVKPAIIDTKAYQTVSKAYQTVSTDKEGGRCPN